MLAIGLAGLFEARGEVSARLDSETLQYAGMLVKYSSTSRHIWSSTVPTVTRRPLNPTGDTLGDLAPTVVENPQHNNWPMVVWSHPNGADYDLVFSRWTDAGWIPTQFVQADNFFNDLDPRLAFNSQGRPYMVWWTDEAGTGAVYFSIFLETRWMMPVRISSTGADSRHPDLTIQNDLRVRVVYDVGESQQVRTVTIPNSDTINDDIDPKFRSQISID
jgi:hypothetical protein